MIKRASQVVLLVKNLPADAGNLMRYGFDPWVGKISWGREWQSTIVFLSRKSHEQRSLAGYSPEGGKESDMIEQLTLTHFLPLCVYF